LRSQAQTEPQFDWKAGPRIIVRLLLLMTGGETASQPHSVTNPLRIAFDLDQSADHRSQQSFWK
jgi:hypothetical protein